MRKQWVVAFRRAVGYQERPHIREKKKKKKKSKRQLWLLVILIVEQVAEQVETSMGLSIGMKHIILKR